MRVFYIAFLFLFSNNAISQVTQEWVSRYNGTANFSDFPKKVIADRFGNVYVGGHSTQGNSSQDYTIIKYNSNGVQQWISFYNGNVSGPDYGNSIAIDNSGNVYITGKSLYSGYDIVTVKYNTNGIQQWAAVYNGPLNGGEDANSVTVDEFGNVYVTGYSLASSNNIDFITIKYNSSGVQQWVRTYNGPGHQYDEAKIISTDIAGYIYITGWSFGNGTGYDYCTIKYNSQGSQQWVARYNNSYNGIDEPNSMAVGNNGNVYVTGVSQGSGTNYDFATIKYNSAGDLQWVSRYNGTGNFIDRANSLKIDSFGNVYVTGNSSGVNLASDYVTIKYNAQGVQQWFSDYNGRANDADVALDIVLDNLGNIYVTGYSYSSPTDEDITTVKYNNIGNQQWVIRYNHSLYDEGVSISIDNLNNIYVCGNSGTGMNADFATIKYSQPIGIQIISSEIPEHFTLSQNYPNPFNPNTKIQFALPEAAFTKIVIFDLLGNEIETIVSEQLNAGSYETQWNAVNYPSGVYYYQLTAGDYKETKKMVLIK